MRAAERPAQPALDRDTDNAAGRGPQGLTKWGLLDWLKRHSSLSRQRVCMLDANPGGVVLSRVEGHASFTSAVVCGVRSCPNCGPRIALAHREDIHQVVTRARARGYSVRFLTLTLRHTREDRLADTLDALLACWRALTNTGSWTRAKRQVGLVGAVRVLECKFSHRAGWHPHLHVLLFMKPAANLEGMVGDLFAMILQRWKFVTQVAGYSASVEAQDMREVGDEHLDRIAGYVTKEQQRDIALEITGQDFKTRGESVGPLGLLHLAAAGDEHARLLYREYEQASKGRRLYAAPSAALRDALAVEPEPSEPEAAREPVADARERLAVLPRGEFRAMARVRGFRGDTALVVEQAIDGWEVVDYLDRRGISARLYRPDDPAAPVAAAPISDGVQAVF